MAAPAYRGLRIVGIGASAGGLVALEEFFAGAATGDNVAYVVVQHLDPTAKGLLPELLQRGTSLQVRPAQHLEPIESGCVYVIPPNTELTVRGHVLHLQPPEAARGMRLPINAFFVSLARDWRDQAIAVILSGMGSDGTLGMQAVKAMGGLTAVQQPDTAQFDSMPSSAIAAGCVDIVAPPAELRDRILDQGVRAAIEPAPQDIAAEPSSAESFTAILRQLQRRTRHDFSLYKPSTLHRRIERRMVIHSIATLSGYAEFVRRNDQEADLLFKELCIGVTSFFRDPAVWEHLAGVALPALLERREGQKLRAWVAGCSTGEEAYSLAMLFEEVAGRMPGYRGQGLQIFASDLNLDAVMTARRGQYPEAIGRDVIPERLARFFVSQDGRYRVRQEIRDMVVFAQHDVLLDPPFTKLDVLSCRNLMIYFDASLQRRLLPLFHYSLLPGGVLLLGGSETIGRFDRLFIPLDAKFRMYTREESASKADADLVKQSFPPLSEMKNREITMPVEPMSMPSADALEAAADRVLLLTHAPPAVVVNDGGDIVYISGRTGRYLEPAAGKANWNFHAMVREELRAPLAEALKRSAEQTDPVTASNLRLKVDGALHAVDVTVQALREPAALRGMVMIVFREAAPPAASRRKTHSAVEAAQAAEIQTYRERIQSLDDETRASKEELQSANEELQSTNEELQSANEELTSSKEEMQSMNEELQTINVELQTKLDALALAQSDMKNLLNSTEIAMLFLDRELNVRRFTDRASRIINLREVDIGRPLGEITTSLKYPELNADALDTLQTLKFCEKEVAANDGRWFSVRIMPYRRLDNVIDGAVITLVDITATKELESKLRGAAGG